MDKNLLIPAVLSALVVVVLVGMFLGGAFNSSGNLDKNALERVVAATGWRVSQVRAGSRDVTTLTPADGSWEIVLRTSERTGSRGTGGASSVFTTGGSGTAWHAASPSFPGFLAVAPGEPVPEGAVNDLLAGPRGAMLAAVLPRVMRDLAGGDVPAPARLVGVRSGDAGFDASYTLVADDPAWAAGLLSEALRAAVQGVPEASLVLSSAGVQLALSGAPALDPAALQRLVDAGLRVQAALGR